MKEVFINKENLSESEIDEIVVRTKALIINDKEEITLVYSHQSYQFPGGHLEEGETIEDCLRREVKEEIGIDLDEELNLFYKIKYYNKNYRDTNKNRENDIYYYLVKTNKKYDIDKVSFEELEKYDNMKIVQIPINDVEETLMKTVNDNSINNIIYEEMMKVINEYLKEKKLKTMVGNMK